MCGMRKYVMQVLKALVVVFALIGVAFVMVFVAMQNDLAAKGANGVVHMAVKVEVFADGLQ